MIEFSHVSKLFGAQKAVNDLNLNFQEGSFSVLIGTSGSGKSTTLKMLCGLAHPTEGEISLYGKPSHSPLAARRIGCLIESAGIYPNLTARQNMIMKSKCIGLTDEKKADDLLTLTGLSPAEPKKAKTFSMGMKQRLGIALALLGNPDLLILDEPINGLDPKGVREIRQLILKLNQEGKTFLISSHILGELSKISTHYGIIQNGNLVEQLEREELERNCEDYFFIQVDDPRRALALIQEYRPYIRAEAEDGSTLHLYGLQEGGTMNRYLIENRIQVYASGFHHMDLEEYFLARMDGAGATEQRKETKSHV